MTKESVPSADGIICVDGKPSIRGLERTQGYLKLANGRALSGHSHDDKRNGTTTLFAAFEVATGKVTVAHKRRRRRVLLLPSSAYPHLPQASRSAAEN